MDSDLLTSAEVASLARVSHVTLQRWRDAGKLPYIRVGRTIRYRREDVDALLSPTTEPQDGAA